MPDLVFNIKPSKFYLRFLFVLLIANVFIVWHLPFVNWIKLLVLFLMTVYVGYILWGHGFLCGKHSITQIRRHSDGSWSLKSQDTTNVVKLCGDSTVTTFLCILRFRHPKKWWPRSSIIFCDSLEPDAYRQMLVALKTTSIP